MNVKGTFIPLGTGWQDKVGVPEAAVPCFPQTPGIGRHQVHESQARICDAWCLTYSTLFPLVFLAASGEKVLRWLVISDADSGWAGSETPGPGMGVFPGMGRSSTCRKGRAVWLAGEPLPGRLTTTDPKGLALL